MEAEVVGKDTVVEVVDMDIVVAPLKAVGAMVAAESHTVVAVELCMEAVGLERLVSQ
jgi:hypothetical protein